MTREVYLFLTKLSKRVDGLNSSMLSTFAQLEPDLLTHNISREPFIYLYSIILAREPFIYLYSIIYPGNLLYINIPYYIISVRFQSS